MKTRFVVLTMCCLLLVSLASAQTKAKAASATAGVPDKALLQNVIDAWASMDTAKPAPYYDKAPANVFYDISPLKYTGWQEYAKGVNEFFATVQSLKMSVNDDFVVHRSGNLAWTTATVNMDMTPKTGAPSTLNCRWTTIWEHKGGKWLIVHEHFSTPMPEPK